MNEQFHIKNLQVEFQNEPLGLDVIAPRFSWCVETDQYQWKQEAYQLIVKNEKRNIVYQTGKVWGDCQEIDYKGLPLEACTKYNAELTVWATDGASCIEHTSFETGLMNDSISAWQGAKWIGANRFTVDASTRSVFSITGTISIREGNSAGIVFGRNDRRLLDPNKNEYGICGEHYICYALNIESFPARLIIYRVGYALNDTQEVPYSVIPVQEFGNPQNLIITKENCRKFHELSIKVTGNCAYAYIDGYLVDAIKKELFGHFVIRPRQLNPRGDNDVLTYPHLNEIGFFASPHTKAYFKGLSVRNLREPGREYIRENVNGGLYGTKGIFRQFLLSGELYREDDCFVMVTGGEKTLITAEPDKTSIPMLRRTFALQEKPVIRARLYATARGIYDCSINGMKVTDEWFTPGCSQYDHNLSYQTYDVTPYLVSGRNGIGFTLASGWWSDAQTYVLQNYNYYGDKESLLAMLVITYKDESQEVIVTDTENWQYFGQGPYTYAGFFMGERFDARRKDIYDHYSEADFPDDNWEHPEEIEVTPICGFTDFPDMPKTWPDLNLTEPKLTGNYQAPVKVVCERNPEQVFIPRPGIYIYDLGQEMAGVPRIIFHEKAGTQVCIRYGEMLYPDSEESCGMAGMLLLENYRDAESLDTYICQGLPGGETYCPKFTFHGYRYIEVSGVTCPPQLSDVTSLQLSSIAQVTGKFTCSNPLINRFVENVKWSQLCNFISIPTDCPQRNERMGWAGDTLVFCRSALRNADCRLFYYRNLQAFQDLQSDGRYPEIAPAGGGFGGITYESAPIMITWDIYNHYGDKKVVKQFYPDMKKYIDYLVKKGMPGQIFVGPLGDWLATEETDPFLLWNAFFANDCRIMKEFARVLDMPGDISYFSCLEEEAVKYWNAHFIEGSSGKTCNFEGSIVDTQCSYVLPLVFHIVLPKYRKKFQEHLVRKTRELCHTVSTGFFGTGYLNEALTIAGYERDAYQLMTQTRFPSWLYPVTQGATTIWERWDSYTYENGFGGNNNMNSFNHYSLGAVISWLYDFVLGIRRQKGTVGYQKLLLEPHINTLTYAKGSMVTPYGRVASEWSVHDNKVHFYCRIPANTEAKIILPKGRIISAAKMLQHKEESEDFNIWSTGAGEYEFEIERDEL